jgi:hypothetical protein
VQSPAIEALAGMSFTSRKLDFDADDVGAPPQGYAGAMVPGLLVDMSIFPAAFKKDLNGILRGFGLTAMVDRVFKIESKVQGMDVVLATSQMRYGAGLVYRHIFSPKKSSGISARAFFRYSKLDFTIDKGGNAAVTIPNVAYTYLEPGVQVNIPVTPQIDLSAASHFYIIQSTGEIQKQEEYGAAAVTGFDVELGAKYKITPRIVAQAAARYALISHLFNGNGDRTDRDVDGEQDVASAADSYIGFLVTAGYLY